MNCALIILNYMDKNRSLQLAQRCISYECIDHVIVVDNCSPDDSYEWLLTNNKDVNITILKTDRNGGFSYGNNYGSRYAVKRFNPKFILFANPDTIFSKNDVNCCLNALKSNKDIGLISLRIKNIEGFEENSCWKEKSYLQLTLFCIWLYRRRKYNSFNYDLNKNTPSLLYVDVVRGSFMCFKAKALVDIDYFDENTFLYYEEDIISKRLYKKNYKIAILTEHFYIHNHVYNKNYNELSTKNNLDKSMYYMLKEYYNINLLQKIFTKIIICYSTIEYTLLYEFKKWRIFNGK